MNIKACDICGKRIKETKSHTYFRCPASDGNVEMCIGGNGSFPACLCTDCASAIQNAINEQRRAALDIGLNIDFVEEKDDKNG